jgi:hypothetical protein
MERLPSAEVPQTPAEVPAVRHVSASIFGR